MAASKLLSYKVRLYIAVVLKLWLAQNHLKSLLKDYQALLQVSDILDLEQACRVRGFEARIFISTKSQQKTLRTTAVEKPLKVFSHQKIP